MRRQRFVAPQHVFVHVKFDLTGPTELQYFLAQNIVVTRSNSMWTVISDQPSRDLERVRLTLNLTRLFQDLTLRVPSLPLGVSCVLYL